MHEMTTPSQENPPPKQSQEYPGRTSEMDPRPRDEMRGYEGRGLLAGKRALITGGDSGIGRAVGVAFAKEGADVAIAYLSEQEDEDAQHTAELIEKAEHRCVTIRGDLAEEANCQRAVDQAVHELGGLDILVNNVATQQPVQDFAELTSRQWDRTFKVNIYSYFWTTKAAYPHLPDGGAVINTASINGLRGNKTLIDYSATKGAILALTYSLAQTFQERGIRVNSVAPGPVWTPLIPATFDEEMVSNFGAQVPMGRAAHPDEIAPSYVFFAAGRMSSYYSGEVLAPVGGETMPGSQTSRRTSMVSGLLDDVTRGQADGLERDLRGRVDGEVRFDAGTRGAYSTDASNFRQVPVGVVLPRTPDAGRGGGRGVPGVRRPGPVPGRRHQPGGAVHQRRGDAGLVEVLSPG
jgi:NAD(P)-dependent dehydrogenase (short-subunit alcohol dehydrogenase family)